MNGSFAAKLKARAQIEMMKEEEKMNDAARRIQNMWRIRQGGLAAHLKRQAKLHLQKEEELILKKDKAVRDKKFCKNMRFVLYC
jgi:hypothetical protein